MPSVLSIPGHVLTLPGNGSTVQQPVSIIGNFSLLSQILQGVQAGSLAITGYYQGQAMINNARAEAEAARYGTTPQPNTVQGQVSGSADMTPLLLLGGGFLLLMMMQQKK